MKTPSFLQVAGSLSLTFLISLSAHARTWTSSDGSSTFEGELIAYDAATGKVTVDRAGKQMTFGQDRLSADDIAFLKETGTVKVEEKPAAAAATTEVAEVPDVLPDPDGKEADMSKPVQVFILMGQSNMLGFGKVNQLQGVAPDKYPYLVDDAGQFNVRKDVRNVFYNNGGLSTNDWMAGDNRNKIGPEIGIGNYLGHAIDAPVMILKSCVGNRALGWDLLPPSAVGTGTGGKSYEGTSDYGSRKVNPDAAGWYAGLQYDKDIGAVQDGLKDLGNLYPGATKYEVAGFFWWQGCSEKKGNPAEYDKNLAFLFSDLKKEFNAPNAKFVGATLGEHDKNAALAQKMFAFADAHEDAGFFYSKPVSKNGSCGHYGGDAETYMNVGEGMGKMMIELLAK